MAIAFNNPSVPANTLEYVREALSGASWEGDGPFSIRCHVLLRELLDQPALLTTSCSAALDMSALLIGVGPGDEVIMPSYTFVSTANAFALRGATPVFVDVRDDTLNLDEMLVERAITNKTKAIVPVHYAGIACEMDALVKMATAKGIYVIEDAAQGLLAKHRDKPLGTLGSLGSLSFHVSKNIVCGEGGALVINDASLLERAKIVREKGTNRTAFMEKKVDKYEWLDLGSSYLPSDLLAAVLLAQLESAEQLTHRRLTIWRRYHSAFLEAEERGHVRRPSVPQNATPNGHIYYIRLRNLEDQRSFRAALARDGISALTHYVPLHSSPAGRRLGRAATDMNVTNNAAECLVRLPIYASMTDQMVDRVISAALEFFSRL
jgi:dTDP-4-amino-4,6-dideoxygalactose transaminase